MTTQNANRTTLTLATAGAAGAHPPFSGPPRRVCYALTKRRWNTGSVKRVGWRTYLRNYSSIPEAFWNRGPAGTQRASSKILSACFGAVSKRLLKGPGVMIVMCCARPPLRKYNSHFDEKEFLQIIHQNVIVVDQRKFLPFLSSSPVSV